MPEREIVLTNRITNNPNLHRSYSGKWDNRFLDAAFHVADWSKDPNTKVGAVIAVGKHEVSRGYNGLPRGLEDTPQRYTNRALKHKLVIHAEQNAIDNAREPIAGYTIYSTLFPCIRCTVAIINNELSRVVTFEPTAERHCEDFELSLDLFKEAGVVCDIYREMK